MTDMQKPVLSIAGILLAGYLLFASPLLGLFWLQVFGTMFYYAVIVPACAIALIVVFYRKYRETSRYKKQLNDKGLLLPPRKRTITELIAFTLIGVLVAIIFATSVYGVWVRVTGN